MQTTLVSDPTVVERTDADPVRVGQAHRYTHGGHLYSFEGLGPHPSGDLEKVQWYRMRALSHRACPLLYAQGYRGSENAIKFHSFEPEALSALVPQYTPFSWLTHNDEEFPFETTYCLDGRVEGMDFENPRLYVIKQWCDIVFACIRIGVVEIDVFGGGRIRGLRWNNTVVHHLDLVDNLRAEIEHMKQ